jgi:hypothetical protein
MSYYHFFAQFLIVESQSGRRNVARAKEIAYYNTGRTSKVATWFDSQMTR